MCARRSSSGGRPISIPGTLPAVVPSFPHGQPVSRTVSATATRVLVGRYDKGSVYASFHLIEQPMDAF
jgi:hypothetical protein